jgi:hypothetical protein
MARITAAGYAGHERAAPQARQLCTGQQQRAAGGQQRRQRVRVVRSCRVVHQSGVLLHLSGAHELAAAYKH